MIIFEQPPSLDFSPFWRELPNGITQIPMETWLFFGALFVLSLLAPEPVRRRYRRRRW